ncbi:DUF2306 domain-containing protein [Novosphingobium sp. FSY-8]|uniref:DUF2306 domain-containing protein n=1 Tax=Novosphingobium ovatum TaxID=1908523 RepID=A0ABW9XF35_9SPHN|nr:DUF2306 domain-containing protein [Novosphingobium ovatum]NBC37147.1 DUF2306 domain-containing protein [Novosphingobium ovatum]
MRTALRGVEAAFDSADFPEDLAIKVELLPVVFPLHMVTGAAALLAVPVVAWLGAQGLARGRGWARAHRWAGRGTALIVAVAGITAFPVALVQPVTQLSAAGFVAQGAAWLGLLGAGVWHIAHGRVAAHRACMIMMCAVTSGAIFFRVYLAFWAILAQGRFFAVFYACDAWVGWLLPLAVAAWMTRHAWRDAAAFPPP